MNNESILSSSDRTCPECGRKFIINSQWVYRLDIKGHTSWYCRYNCVRAGERKYKESKTGRMKELKSKKPSREVLEKDLRSGIPIAQIAKKHEGSVQSVHNWIKSYGLAGIQGVKKPVSEKQTSAGDDFDIIADQARRAEEIITKPIFEEMVQESPTLVEIEQFHTDTEVQALPVVEMGEIERPEPKGNCTKCFKCDNPLVDNKCGKFDQVVLDKPEEEMPDEEYDRIMSTVEVKLVEPPCEPITAEVEPAPRETFDEIWLDVHDDLVTLERLYVAQAKQSFRDKLRGLLADVVGSV